MATTTLASKMPETIKTGNVTRNAGGEEQDRSSSKVLDSGDQIPELPLACWKGNEERVERCKEHFRKRFNASPTFCVRVPGRVNLIGEHIDYCGFGVFPMALEHDILILGRSVVSPEALGGRAVLRLTNLGEEFEDFECNVADIRSILQNRKQGVAPGWHLYYLCGVLGTLETLGKVEGEDVYLTEICVDGRVPPRAGLSSSSAMVCAAALATLVAYEGKLGRKEMASICARSERYIGTEGGGMDQAIAFMATAGTAQLIEFVPRLHGENVKLPENAVFVIANSLAESNKAATSHYNVRVAECRTATWILAKAAGLPNFCEINTLKSLQQQLGQQSLIEMSSLVGKYLHEEPYTPKEIAEILGMGLNELKSKPLMVKINVADDTQLKLHQRAKHVLEEAHRVHEFRRICEAEGEEKLAHLGQLMNASHASLRDLYDCTHPRVEELIHLSRPFTFGVRQTGAGWGGCVVALLEADRVQAYLKCLQGDYYLKNFGINNTDSCVFVTQPGSGANILLCESS